MRPKAIEECAKLIAKAVQEENYQAAKQYAVKLEIICDRSEGAERRAASVIKEMINQ